MVALNHYYVNCFILLRLFILYTFLKNSKVLISKGLFRELILLFKYIA